MHRDSNPIFVHVPRTAGTAIRQALRLGTGELHTPALELRHRLGSREWSARFSFGFVRNPWDRVLSLYRKLQPAGAPEGFREWVLGGFPAPRRDGVNVAAPMLELLGDGRRPIVDFIGRYEELAFCWARIRARVAPRWRYPVPETLPRIDSTGGEGCQRWYDPELLDLVARRYAGDIAVFGYEPSLTDLRAPT